MNKKRDSYAAKIYQEALDSFKGLNFKEAIKRFSDALGRYSSYPEDKDFDTGVMISLLKNTTRSNQEDFIDFFLEFFENNSNSTQRFRTVRFFEPIVKHSDFKFVVHIIKSLIDNEGFFSFPRIEVLDLINELDPHKRTIHFLLSNPHKLKLKYSYGGHNDNYPMIYILNTLLKLFTFPETIKYLTPYIAHLQKICYSKYPTVKEIIFRKLVWELIADRLKNFLKTPYAAFIRKYGKELIEQRNHLFVADIESCRNYQEMPYMYFILTLTELMGKEAVDNLLWIIKENNLEKDFLILRNFRLKIENAPKSERNKQNVLFLSKVDNDNNFFYLDQREIGEDACYYNLIRVSDGIMEGLKSKDQNYLNASKSLLKKLWLTSLTQLNDIRSDYLAKVVLEEFEYIYWKGAQKTINSFLKQRSLLAKKMYSSVILLALHNLDSDSTITFKFFLFTLLYVIDGRDFYIKHRLREAKKYSHLFGRFSVANETELKMLIKDLPRD